MWLTKYVAINVGDFVRESANNHGKNLALVDTERSLNWEEFDSLIDRISSAMASRGLVAGNRVALASLNSIEMIASYFAVVRSGYVAVPINPNWESIDTVIEQTQPRLAIVDQIGLQVLRGFDLQKIVIGSTDAAAGTSFDDFLNGTSTTVPPSPKDPEALAVIMYTIDGSGRFRGAMLTHRALIANIEQVGRMENPLMDASDSVLLVLPAFHIFGLNAIVGQAARTSASLVVMSRFDPQKTLETIRDHKVTVVPVAPPIIAAWSAMGNLQEYFQSVRRVLSGAAILDPELERSFESAAGVDVEQGWGITEAAPVVSTTVGIAHGIDHPRGYVGVTIPGVEVKTMTEDLSELLVRGDNLAQGYWPNAEDGPDAEGWFHTGDLGFVDPDGSITVVERLTDSFEISGFRVYPFEIEEALSQVDGVEEVVVIGVLGHQGTQVKALVVGQAAPEEILEHANRTLAAYKVPTLIEKINPLGPVVDKSQLRAMARSRELGL